MPPLGREASLAEFRRLFNEEKFFEAHEVLEGWWRAERGEDRDFYHGLIQIAAAWVHLQRGTPQGAVELLRKAEGYLKKFPPRYQSIDHRRLLEETHRSLPSGLPAPKIPPA